MKTYRPWRDSNSDLPEYQTELSPLDFEIACVSFLGSFSLFVHPTKYQMLSTTHARDRANASQYLQWRWDQLDLRFRPGGNNRISFHQFSHFLATSKALKAVLEMTIGCIHIFSMRIFLHVFIKHTFSVWKDHLGNIL